MLLVFRIFLCFFVIIKLLHFKNIVFKSELKVSKSMLLVFRGLQKNILIKVNTIINENILCLLLVIKV